MPRRSLFWTICLAGILILLSIVTKIRNANADFGSVFFGWLAHRKSHKSLNRPSSRPPAG